MTRSRDLGREQAAGVVPALREQGILKTINPKTIAIYSSPFSRALETAEAIADALGIDAGAVQLDDSLRERFFGEALEGAASSSYGSVWEQDAADTSVGPSGGESVVDVASRCQSFVDAVRLRETADVVFLVSHGDTLSILATHVGNRGTLGRHREQGLDNCGGLRSFVGARQALRSTSLTPSLALRSPGFLVLDDMSSSISSSSS